MGIINVGSERVGKTCLVLSPVERNNVLSGLSLLFVM
jgi:hypothetical protein